jgi:LPS export ABC transporter protein LptC
MSPRRIAKLLGGLGAIILAAILLVTVVVVRHRDARNKLASTAVALAPGAFLHAHNFHWTQMKGDQSQWVLKARDASYSDDKTSLLLVKPELMMVAQDGKYVTLTADLAKLKLDHNHIIQADMSGGLVVHYGDFVLETDAAEFEPDRDRLNAPGLVKIKGQDLTVTGIGLVGRPKAETFELQSQVSTTIVPRQKSDAAKVS